jgi:hypothetical protein
MTIKHTTGHIYDKTHDGCTRKGRSEDAGCKNAPSS